MNKLDTLKETINYKAEFFRLIYFVVGYLILSGIGLYTGSPLWWFLVYGIGFGVSLWWEARKRKSWR